VSGMTGTKVARVKKFWKCLYILVPFAIFII